MDTLPDGKALRLSDGNIALIARLAAFDVGNVFSNAGAANNEKVDYPTFIFSADTSKEREASPQRVFRLRGIVHYESDVNLLVESIRTNEPRSAVRVIQLCYGKLRRAVQYDPLDGLPNDDVPISD